MQDAYSLLAFVTSELHNSSVKILDLGRSDFMFRGSSWEQRKECINNVNKYVNIPFKHKYNMRESYC